jgi:hypothetical protein
MKNEKENITVDSEKTTIEYDDSKTFSGLPAPAYWHIVERGEDGLMWQRLTGEPITVIESTVEKDGCTWLHVSVAKPVKKGGQKKMPTYEDVQAARALFIGEHRECYSIYPSKDRYVNLNPVLHLWCNLDCPSGVLPHFEGVTTIAGKEMLSV